MEFGGFSEGIRGIYNVQKLISLSSHSKDAMWRPGTLLGRLAPASTALCSKLRYCELGNGIQDTGAGSVLFSQGPSFQQGLLNSNPGGHQLSKQGSPKEVLRKDLQSDGEWGGLGIGLDHHGC